ncbi:hypothetical protein MKW94_026898, partial [Papaver nudicaule]|nr:hypothetical protein [Papaver nudicaule]
MAAFRLKYTQMLHGGEFFSHSTGLFFLEGSLRMHGTHLFMSSLYHPCDTMYKLQYIFLCWTYSGTRGSNLDSIKPTSRGNITIYDILSFHVSALQLCSLVFFVI